MTEFKIFTDTVSHLVTYSLTIPVEDFYNFDDLSKEEGVEGIEEVQRYSFSVNFGRAFDLEVISAKFQETLFQIYKARTDEEYRESKSIHGKRFSDCWDDSPNQEGQIDITERA